MTQAAATRKDDTPVREIADELNRHVEAIVSQYLSAGKRQGHEWRVGSIHNEPGGSLMVKLSGTGRGRFYDFHGGVGGDMLDFMAHRLYGGNKGEAVAWAKAYLGLSGDAAPRTRAPVPVEADTAQDEADAARKSAYAMAIFLEASPTIVGTPVAKYLAGRGLDLQQLGRATRSLRFHRSLKCTESRSSWPAMVAAVSNTAGEHIGTHRTWLAMRDGRWKKAPLKDAKKAVGHVRGGSVRLWRGASGKSLKDAPQGDVVAIAEGIETALSVAIACPELRVLAACWSNNLRSIDLPPTITRVIICADNDEGNPDSGRDVERAVARYQAEGREVHVAMPDVPGADWNDVLQGVEG